MTPPPSSLSSYFLQDPIRQKLCRRGWSKSASLGLQNERRVKEMWQNIGERGKKEKKYQETNKSTAPRIDTAFIYFRNLLWSLQMSFSYLYILQRQWIWDVNSIYHLVVFFSFFLFFVILQNWWSSWNVCCALSPVSQSWSHHCLGLFFQQEEIHTRTHTCTHKHARTRTYTYVRTLSFV